MKSFYKFLLVLSIFLFISCKSYSQIPSYTLEAKNFILVNQNRITFDIILTHTDLNTFEYAASQHFFRVPQAFATLGIGTGTNSGYQYDSIGGHPQSDFPVTLIPRNPSVVTTTVNGIPSYELRLAGNLFPGNGNGLIIPQYVSKLVIRMKLISATPFNLSYFNIILRDSCSENPISVTRTKLNTYIGTSNIEITRCVNHYVDISGIKIPPINCQIKLALEGFYNSGSDKHNRSETATAYLRRAFSPYQIVDSASAEIDSNNLTGDFQFSASTFGGTYYIVINHRNNLETWSKAGGENLLNGNNRYDFTSSASQAYGNNMILKGSRYCIYSGNVNNDMIIDAEDLLLIDNDLFNYITGNAVADLNGDNLVDIEDMSIADKNATDIVLVEWPGLTYIMRKHLLKNKFNDEGIK